MHTAEVPEAQQPQAGNTPVLLPWSLDDIPFSDAATAGIRGEAVWFHVLAAASFVETDTPNYTALLLRHFEDHAGARQWLREHWLPEEVQHGRALRRYVEQVWPEFDWPRAYADFSARYAQVTNEAHLETDRGLEMVARCVVEVGTSTFYTALANRSPDPVLRMLCHRIAQDEVRHYTYFLRFFEDYAARHPYRRWSILRTEWRRAAEVEREDMVIATASAGLGLPAGHPLAQADYAAVRHAATALLRETYPARMGVIMLLKPLHLGHPLRRALVPVLSRAAILMLRR